MLRKKLTTKKIFFLFMVLTALKTGSLQAVTTANPSSSLADSALIRYLEKPRFTKTGLADFFNLQFNNQLYAQFLPRSFVHIVDFIDYAQETNKPISFVIKVFNLFDQRIKECLWVNSYALIALMNEFLARLPRYCTIEESGDRAAQIKTELKKLYEKNKAGFKKKPELFFDQASKTLDATLQQPHEHLDALELQLRTTKLLEEAIGKLIWNPHDQLEIWNTIGTIATKLQELHHAGVISSLDDLNILTWTLIYRFGYFIDCAGSQLSAEFFKQMSDDIGHNKIPLFMISEQEHFLLTKKQYLDDLVVRGKAKSEAAKSGIYVDGIL